MVVRSSIVLQIPGFVDSVLGKIMNQDKTVAADGPLAGTERTDFAPRKAASRADILLAQTSSCA